MNTNLDANYWNYFRESVKLAIATQSDQDISEADQILWQLQS